MSEHNITFEEFTELCTETGISTDDLSVLEQDFRSGRALADVTDALITGQEEDPEPSTRQEAVDRMDTYLTLLEDTDSLVVARETAIKLAVQAIRLMSEALHDEGKN